MAMESPVSHECQTPNMNIDIHSAQVAALWEAADDMAGNIAFIEGELPGLGLPDAERERIAEACSYFVNELYDVRTEIRNLEDKLGLHPGEEPYDPDIVNPDPRGTMELITDALMRGIECMGGLVSRLQGTPYGTPGISLALSLVMESATNIFHACSRANKAFAVIKAHLDAEPVSVGKETGMNAATGVQDPALTATRLTPERIEAEIARRLPPEARASGQPVFVLIMGPVCAGKTTLRRQKYASGHVLVDAAQIFIDLGGIDLAFPSTLLELMEAVGAEVARRAVAGRMHIVTEVVGSEFGPVAALIDAMKGADYKVELVGLTADLEACMERNASRAQDNISAYYAEPFQTRWLVEAARMRPQ